MKCNFEERTRTAKVISKSVPARQAGALLAVGSRHITFWSHPRCHEREAEASTPWHRGFRGPSMVRLDRPTARTHRAATRRVDDQAITSPGCCALNQSLRAQIDANDPDLRHGADQYGRSGPSPSSEADLAFRGPFRLLWPPPPAHFPPPPAHFPPPEAEFSIIDFVLDGKSSRSGYFCTFPLQRGGVPT